MQKKILGICAALVAFAAFAVMPALASASPVVTEEGKALATGTTITATATNTIFTGSSPEGTVTCEQSDMHGKLVTNSGTSIEGTIESATFTNCTSPQLGSVKVTTPTLKAGTAHWCIRTTKTADQWELAGENCNRTAGAALTFILDTGLAGECGYKRANNAALTGTFTTNTTPVPLTLGAGQTFERESGGFLCPASATLSMKYTLETAASPFTGLTIS